MTPVEFKPDEPCELFKDLEIGARFLSSEALGNLRDARSVKPAVHET
jgi:hypothetical protein